MVSRHSSCAARCSATVGAVIAATTVVGLLQLDLRLFPALARHHIAHVLRQHRLFITRGKRPRHEATKYCAAAFSGTSCDKQSSKLQNWQKGLHPT
eukprot:798635-Amphidinium_carterae.1